MRKASFLTSRHALTRMIFNFNINFIAGAAVQEEECWQQQGQQAVRRASRVWLSGTQRETRLSEAHRQKIARFKSAVTELQLQTYVQTSVASALVICAVAAAVVGPHFAHQLTVDTQASKLYMLSASRTRIRASAAAAAAPMCACIVPHANIITQQLLLYACVRVCKRSFALLLLLNDVYCAGASVQACAHNSSICVANRELQDAVYVCTVCVAL